METFEQLKRAFPDIKDKATLEKLGKLRHKARTDLLWLANDVLDYHFAEDVHKPLFACFPKKDADTPFDLWDKVKNRLILWPRGHYKSTAEIVEIVQLILNDPAFTILIMSSTQQLAQSLLKLVKDHFEANEKLANLFPEFCGKDLGSVKEFRVPNQPKAKRDPTVFTSTLTSNKAGRHCDAIFLDDVVNEINSATPEEMAKVLDGFINLTPLFNNGTGYLYVIGTRWSHADLYGWIIENIRKDPKLKEQWVVSVKKAWSKTYHKDTLGRKTQNLKEVKLLFPQRRLESGTHKGKLLGYTVEMLEAEQAKDPVYFSRQWENDPIIEGAEIFNEELLTNHLLPYDKIPAYGSTVIVWDLAWTDNVKNDRSVGVVARVGEGNKLYVVDVRAGHYAPHELIQHILDLTVKWRPVKVALEKCPGATALITGLEPLARRYDISLPLEFIPMSNSDKAKTRRIMCLQSPLLQDQLYFFDGLGCWEEMKQQFLHFPKGAKDDYPDAVSLLLEMMPSVQSYVSPDDHPAYRVQPQAQVVEDDCGLGGLGGFLVG